MTTRHALRRMRFFSEPFRDFMAAMDAQVARASRPKRAFLIVLLSSVASWWVYVPVHELLHALGCYVAGGSVSELQIAPRYGGTLLARVLPFVVGDSDYAGRLSGFDTKGSDLIYLATDALPFLLSVFIGVPLLKACAGGARPVLLGAAFVLGLAPFSSLTGDYYEMGSIITTRAMGVLHGAGGPPPFAALRSDDVVKLVSDVFCDGLGACLGECPEGAITIEERSAILGSRSIWEYDELFIAPKTQMQAGAYASNPKPFETMLLCMLIELKKELKVLEQKVARAEGPAV